MSKFRSKNLKASLMSFTMFTCTLFSEKGRCFNQSERALYGNFIIIMVNWEWLLTSSQGWYIMKNQNPSYFIKRSYIAHANPSNMWCDFIFLQTFFAIRITCTGTSKRHFDCCSVILKINVEGKKLTNLYRYI